MARHRNRKRHYRMINFKVYYDTDQDILDWWDSIEDGDRSETIRDLIRVQLGIEPKGRRLRMVDLPELTEVRRDTLWIKDALNDMPAYLERVIQHVASTVTESMVVAQYPPRASPAKTKHEPAMSDADAERRASRMRKAKW